MKLPKVQNREGKSLGQKAVSIINGNNKKFLLVWMIDNMKIINNKIKLYDFFYI